MSELTKAEEQTCPACGTHFVCGAAQGQQSCWCMEKPTGLIEPEVGGSCLCPRCLNQRISARSAQAT